MIARKLFSFIACISIGWLVSCNNDRIDIGYVGRLSFSLQQSDSLAPSASRKSAGSSVSKVLVSIEAANGDIVYNMKELELFKFGDEYFTDDLQFPIGSYRVTKFLAVDDDNNVVYAIPAAGSKHASLVERPLPVAFSIHTDITSILVLEVISVEDQNPADFGYLSFKFKIIETKTIAINVVPSDYKLEVIAKDGPLGTVQWTGSWDFEGPTSVKIPWKYGHYTFKASKNGHLSHVQHYTAGGLNDVTQIDFELLQSLDDFFVKSIDGITVYFPKENCKLYTRIDVPEGYKIDYILTDKGNDRIVECFRQCNPVNIFNNIPYQSADTYCSSTANVIVNYYPPGSEDVALAYFLQEW